MTVKTEENDITRLNFKKLKGKPVHTLDGILLGIMHSANNEHILVRKDVIKSIHRIPLVSVKRWDGHALWLGISETEAAQHLISTDGDVNVDDTDYESITFRLNESVMNGIRTEADSRMISMNNLVNHILERFVKWDKLEAMSGMIHINKPVVIEIFNKKNTEEIVDLAKSTGKKAIYNTVLFMKGKKDLDTFLLWLENEMNKHSFNVRHLIEGNMHSYVIKHDMGYNFSLYYKTIIEEIFSDYLEKKVDFTLSDELVLFKFESRR